MNANQPPPYVEVSWTISTRMYVITVDGCVVDTQIAMPANLVKGSVAWITYVGQVAQSVQANMDPNNGSYDPALLGEGE